MTEFGFVTLTSDFGVQSQSVGVMELTVRELAPSAQVVHFMHGLPSFQLAPAARTLECLKSVAPGVHVCVVDPGVGTQRRGVAISTSRGDILVGPDNGVMLPALEFLGGVKDAVSLSNSEFHHPRLSSSIFHGRDVFSPVAAHLFRGTPIQALGESVPIGELVGGPYSNAEIAGCSVMCTSIQVSKFGAVHLNIMAEEWIRKGPALGSTVDVQIEGGTMASVVACSTFGEVDAQEDAVLLDDYGRVELACNLGSFADKHGVGVGASLVVSWGGGS